MIAIKTIIFFFAFGATLQMIDEMIMRTILDSKKEYDEYRENFVHGYTTLLEGRMPIITIVLWTAFYLVNQF